jgi:predicted dehydrogenase
MKAIRMGVVGVGQMGRTHVAALTALPGVEVSCICDADEEALAEVAREFSVPRTTTDTATLLQSEIDAVVVATPEADHCIPTLEALDAGKHVLVEKPLATTLEDAHAMSAAAARADRILMPGLTLRYEPRYRLVKDWLRDGDRGEIASLYVRRNRPASLFDHYSRIHPAFETGSHDVDLILWYTGQRIQTVFALERRRPQDQTPHGIWALAELERGAVATLETVWLTPGQTRVERNDVLELIADRGTALVDIGRYGVTFLQEDGIVMPDPILDPNSLNPTSLAVRAEVEDFVRCIRDERESPETSLADAVHAVEIIEAMIRSAQTKAPVHL